jgi:hypothetical protein
MNNKFYKINSWISLIINGISIIALIWAIIDLMIYANNSTTDWGVLGTMVLMLVAGYATLLNILSLISNITALKYYENKKAYKPCFIFTLIAIILFSITALFWSRPNAFALELLPSWVPMKSFVAIILIFIIYILPLIINMIGIHKYKN